MDRLDRITWAATAACALEVSSEKPGNVTPTHDFCDTSFEDFLLSAAATGPVLGQAGALKVGALVRLGVQRTREQVGVNTNLGILLLMAPVARAYATAPAGPPESAAALRMAVAHVLTGLDAEDAADVYDAIRVANPGGLGRAENDVREPPRVPLQEAMAQAAERDAIAREYSTVYDLTCRTGLPALERALAGGSSLRTAAQACFLELLAEWPDTLILRKLGPAAAEEVSREAAAVLRLTGPLRREALTALTRRLRDPANQYNPGTTADLVACSLFWHLLLSEGR
jgi:triphosphoribosyl-dephospho-CoA synthase